MDGAKSLVYIDAVICREWDKNSEGSAPGDEALEDRTFYAQNGRGDAVALLTSGGTLIETVRYSAYGVPFGAPAGDTDADGDYDLADKDRLADTLLAYDVRRDVNLDGVVDSDDITAAGSAGQTLGWGVLSKPGTASRRGYAGYEHEGALAGQWTVYLARNRYYLADWQRWFTRDPIGYFDGPNMYAYVRGRAIVRVDPSGLCTSCASGDEGVSVSLKDCSGPCFKCVYDPVGDMTRDLLLFACIVGFLEPTPAGEAICAVLVLMYAANLAQTVADCHECFTCIDAALNGKKISPPKPRQTPGEGEPTLPQPCRWQDHMVYFGEIDTSPSGLPGDRCRCNRVYNHNTAVCKQCAGWRSPEWQKCYDTLKSIDANCRRTCRDIHPGVDPAKQTVPLPPDPDHVPAPWTPPSCEPPTPIRKDTPIYRPKHPFQDPFDQLFWPLSPPY